MSEAKVKTLAGDIDGVNRRFTAPDRFRAGTLRLIWDGVTYPPDDVDHGWAEVVGSHTEIDTTTAPPVGTVLQAFYELPVVRGSPFDPNNHRP